MKLFKELDLSMSDRELISIVGGGGKTTSMFKLGNELLKMGKKVLLTTTTGIFKPNKDSYENMILIADEIKDYSFIKGSTTGITIIGSKIDEKKGKLMGVDSEVIDEIFKSKIFDYIIVEADGSKRKPIKAPASHEPVIPSLTTKTIGVIGMDSVGKRIFEETVHRADIFSDITNSKLGDPIDEDAIYNLIISNKGIFKDSPYKSQKYIILNKSETKERERISKKIKSKILQTDIDIQNIIIGSMIKNVRVSGIIMASGFSRRMKTDKLLLKLGNKVLLQKVIDSCVSSNLEEIAVVYRKEEIKKIAIDNNLNAIFNKNAYEGQSASIKIGIEKIKDEVEGIMFIVADQPYLDSATIDRLIEEFEKDKEKIVIPLYDGENGNPVIFPKSLKNQLSKLSGDTGGKEIINKNSELIKYVEIENYRAGIDMDTVEEYEKLKGDL